MNFHKSGKKTTSPKNTLNNYQKTYLRIKDLKKLGEIYLQPPLSINWNSNNPSSSLAMRTQSHCHRADADLVRTDKTGRRTIPDGLGRNIRDYECSLNQHSLCFTEMEGTSLNAVRMSIKSRTYLLQVVCTFF